MVDPAGSAGPWLHFGLLVPLAAAGMVLSWPRRRDIWFLYALLAAYAISVVATFVMARYRHPLLPLLLLFAAAAVVDGVRRARAHHWRALGVDRAIESFRAAIALDPQLRGPRENLARVLTMAGRREEAAVEYEALRQMP